MRMELVARPTSRVVGLICALFLLGVLYAGLMPFRLPRNTASWNSRANAIEFLDHGVVLSRQPLPPSSTGSRSVEFWATPARTKAEGTILAFYDPAISHMFAVRQSLGDLELRSAPVHVWSAQYRAARVYIPRTLRKGDPSFWTITCDSSKITVYQNGLLRQTIPTSLLLDARCAGRLILGASAVFNDPWVGNLNGLAVYDRDLSPSQIQRHFSTWTSNGTPRIEADDLSIALYLFDEGSGPLIHNRIGQEMPLTIPERYVVVDRVLLDPIWRAFNGTLGFWRDALVNVLGFAPFGYFACLYCSLKGFARPKLIASVAGLLVSILIEIAQSKIPVRDSSMSDVLTNAVGSFFGACAVTIYFGKRLQNVATQAS